jgi:hypothetical protein
VSDAEARSFSSNAIDQPTVNSNSVRYILYILEEDFVIYQLAVISMPSAQKNVCNKIAVMKVIPKYKAPP